MKLSFITTKSKQLLTFSQSGFDAKSNCMIVNLSKISTLNYSYSPELKAVVSFSFKITFTFVYMKAS